MTKHLVKKLGTIFTSFFLLLISLPSSFGQTENATTTLTESIAADGKIHVVTLVISTIFVGIVLFLFYLEKRIKKLEKNN